MGDEEYIVEAILNRRYNEIKKRYEWRVKWEGWDMDNCTWEPIENLEHNTVFLSYIEKKSCLKTKLGDNTKQRDQEETIGLKEDEKESLENRLEGDLKQFRKQGRKLLSQKKNIFRQKVRINSSFFSKIINIFYKKIKSTYSTQKIVEVY